ncbi:LPO_1073/Vpar_1526 family protein [Fictibacillus phosphorivorans]|uniref:LPO_1073/Vpar_1526 family protein n=1 Tax=Fictibacillus phosphorivorans TaxID=1221500 RepID=UPI003CF10C3D
MGNKQAINGGDHSTNIQGNEVIINQQNGISLSDIRHIAMDVFKSNFYDLGITATEIASKRAEEIINEYLKSLQNMSPMYVQNTQDPDIRYSLFEIQKSYARQGEKNKAELLVDLLVERTKILKNSFETIVINEALETVPKLTFEHLNILSLIFIVKHIYLEDNPPFQVYYDKFYDKFLDFVDIPQGLMFYEHLKYCWCVTEGENNEKLQMLIEHFNDGPIFANYPKLVKLSKSWDVSSISHCSLSTVGVALAISNLKMRLGIGDILKLNQYLMD